MAIFSFMKALISINSVTPGGSSIQMESFSNSKGGIIFDDQDKKRL